MMHGRERWEQSFRAPWQIEEEKDIVHRCCVVERIRAQWLMHCHRTASQSRHQEESPSTDVAIGGAAGLPEVRHEGQYRCEWLGQVIHRTPQNQAGVKSLFVDVSRMGERTWQLRV